MKSGVILAGGEGTRLGNYRPYNKHLSLVYSQLMIEYPVQTLLDMGIEHAQIVSNPQGVADMFRIYGDNINGLDVSYETQYHPNGTADALGHTALDGTFPVLCGDVYFDPAPPPSEVPVLYYHEFEGAQNHSVYDPETNTIIEKPIRNIGKRAIVAYYYDQKVYDVIKTLKPSERGELELIDLHNWYLQNGADIKEYKGFFGDMGTPDGLLRVANHIAQKRTLVSQKELRDKTREMYLTMGDRK